MATRFELGAPVQTGFTPLSVPEIRGNEWRYVKECLDTNFVSSVGPFVDRFERAMATSVGSRFAVATVNGTAALHIALLTAGVKPGDEVLVSTLSFIAPANAIRYVGAHPVFVDAERATWQLDVVRAVDFLRRDCSSTGGVLTNKNTGRRVSALLPVHILGNVVDLGPLLDVARELGLAVVEDATESLGARYKGRQTGTLGNLGCFSFNGNKIITTGGGGMIVTDDEAVARKARYLTTQAKDDPLEYVHLEIGYNYRLTNVLAAIGCAQLEQLDAFVEAKRTIARRYDEVLLPLRGISRARETKDGRATEWLYTVLFDETTTGLTSRDVLAGLARFGIQARPLWQPLHRSPAHAGAFRVGGEVAEELNRRALSLPCSVGLSDVEQRRVIDAVVGILSGARAG